MTLRKILAAVMVFILTVLIMPADALTNYQYPVTDLSITDYSGRASASYTLNLKWLRPLPSPRMEGGNNVTQAPDSQASGYEVYYRNATKSQQFAAPINDAALKSNTDANINVQYTLNLDSGSLYVFRVQPFHGHTVVNADGTPFSRTAPIDNSLTETQALYLTDIKLSATASGHNMTVTWDDPTLDGKEIFTGYRFYCSAGGAKVTSFSTEPNAEVSSDSPDLKRTRDGKLQYTFYDETLQVGKLYAVKVEPLFNNREIRTSSPPIQIISVANKEYSLSYRNVKDREYRVNDAYVNPWLNAQPDGQDYVRIFWDSLKTSIQYIESIQIYSSNSQDMANKQDIGTLTGDSAADINFWITARPTVITYYQIVINYKDAANTIIPVPSEIAWFDPAYNDFSPYKPTVLSVTDNAMTPFYMNIQWQAFGRPPYNPEEEQYADRNYKNQYIDRNMIYDIYVTDDIRNYDNPLFNDKIITTLPASRLSLNPFTDGQNTLPSFMTAVTEYYTVSDSGVITRQPLKDNMVYYIRIIATRDPGGQISIPATASHYIRPSGNVDANPLMMTRPPLRIKTNELGVEQVTDKSITIQWDTLYFEAYNNTDKSWYTVVGIGDEGKLLFGTETEKITDPAKIVYLNSPKYSADSNTGEALIIGDLRDKGADPVEIANLPVRLMDIRDSLYEIHTARFDYIQSLGGYETYLKTLQAAGADNKWTAITPAGDPIHPEYAVTLESAPNSGALSVNTAYVIYFRPYVMRNGKKTAYFPSYVMTTTKDAKTPLDITPVVPILEGVGQTDTTLTVRWLYSPDLSYELQYAERPVDYPDKGVPIPWNSITQTAKVTYEEGKAYINYTIVNLFPDTPYIIWIRSAANNALAVVYSAWSNPINMKTLDILPPGPPQGLGPAAREHVDYYNKANGQTYDPIGKTYMILEWMRNQNDAPAVDGNGNAVAPASPAASNNAAFLYAPEVRDMFMAMFSGLTANKAYYARAKTIFTIVEDQAGIRKSYSYTIQLADNPDFLDAYEITLPPLEDLASLNAGHALRKESEWTPAIHIFTARSDSEYDGMVDPEMYPLPDRDYEIMYDDYTGTLTFRFRTDQKDGRGDHDNQVDQRFITRLIEKKTYEYNVDLTRYFYLPVKRRVLDMPYSIFKAFDERLIALKITAGSVSVTFPPGALPEEKMHALHDFGLGSRVLISLTERDSETPALSRGEYYATRPQRLEISVRSPTREIRINQTAQPVNIEMRLLHPLHEYPSHVGAYMAHMDTAGWEQQEAKPNARRDSLLFNVYDAALYAAISAGAPAVIPGDRGVNQPAQSAMRFVSSKLRLAGMEVFIPNSAVSAGQLNQLVNAIANNKLNADLNAPLSAADGNALNKAGLFTAKSPVIRQDAISAMVRLYELRAGKPVTAYKDITRTPFTDISRAAEAYKTPLLKAASLGMLNLSNTWNTDGSPMYYSYRADPEGYLTTGDMFRIAEIVLRDTEAQETGAEAP